MYRLESDMADLVPGLFMFLMATPTMQHEGNKGWSTINCSLGMVPKTYKGWRCNQNNNTNQLHPSTQPQLYVNSEDAVTTYMRGVLSTWVIPSLYILAMMVGISANAYILVFLRVRVKSFSVAVFYLNLALSDLLLLLSLTLHVHYHFNGNNWIFGEMSCRIITAFFYGNVYCSAQSIACISMKRHLAVVRPFLYRRLAKTTMAVWTCLVVWFLFGAAIVPELLVRQSFQIIQLGVTTCHDVLPFEEKSHSILMSYRLMLVCLGFIVPFFLCIYSHVTVVYRLQQSGCDWKPFIRISSLIFIIFVVCFLPSGILHIAHYISLFSAGNDRLYGYYRVAVCLCCFHSCLDPFLCMLISKTTTSELHFISLQGKSQRSAVIT